MPFATSGRQRVAGFAALTAFAVAGCNTAAPTPDATPSAAPAASASVQVVPETRANADIPKVDLSKPPVEAATGTVVDGEQFKAIFPGPIGNYTVTFGDTKAGYAGATLSQGAKKVAALSVNDLASTPKKAERYLSGPQLMGYPSLTESGTSAILVGNRYAVSIRSLNSSFDAKDREEWLMKFKPSNLARLQ